MIYLCGELTYPNDFLTCLAATCGPETYATKEGGIDLLRTARSNNGSEELLMLRGLGEEATITWTFEQAPGRIYNAATGEIIPAEIEPPARSRAGASGIRIRLASRYVTNMGDEADTVVAFNEQVLYSRIANGAYKKGTTVLLEDKWREDPVAEIRDRHAGRKACLRVVRCS